MNDHFQINGLSGALHTNRDGLVRLEIHALREPVDLGPDVLPVDLGQQVAHKKSGAFCWRSPDRGHDHPPSSARYIDSVPCQAEQDVVSEIKISNNADGGDCQDLPRIS